MAAPKVVVIGAGIVGASLADELTARGWTDVTVLDRGPLFATGGSTSHAPGLVFQTNPSKTMSEFAKYTTEKFAGLGHSGGWAFNPVGGLEVASTPERWADLHRKAGWAQSWGIAGELLTAGQCAELHPLLDAGRILGGFHTPTDGLVKAVRAVEAQAQAAIARGATFLANTEVLGILDDGKRVTGVQTADGAIAADVVVCCAGFWGAQLAKQVGLVVPLVPMAHQYATTGRIEPLVGRNTETAEAGLPILRHQDQDLYFREHVDRIGIGYYGHDPMPVDMSTLATDTAGEQMPSMLPFTDDDFAPAWRESCKLLPVLNDSKLEQGFNGIFSFTPDGFSIMGEHRELSGFWVAEAVWVTHSAGVAKATAEWIIDGTPSTDVHECDLYRFEDVARSDDFILTTSSQAFVEVYDIIHPHQFREALRGLRTSPFYPRQQELGAFFYEGGGWERPAWYEANAALAQRLRDGGLPFPERDEWSAKFWSPISIAEAHWTREHVAMYDMTPLTRYEVAGRGAVALLQRLTTNNVDKSVGSVTYTMLLDETGGVRSDLTVARLADDRFQVGANGPLDFDWFTRHLPADGSVTVRDITGATCCVGVWGPAARDVVQPLCSDDLSHETFKYFRALRTHLGAIPVTMMRVSYVGELGWEIYADAAYGAALWDLLWAGGQEHQVIAAGRIAFTTVINALGVKLMAMINSAGVFIELIAAVMIAIILAASTTRGPSVFFTTGGIGAGLPGGYLGAFLIASLASGYVMYGFDTASSLGEETVEPRRTAPKAILRAILASFVIGGAILVFAVMSAPDLNDPKIGESSGGLQYIVEQVMWGPLGKVFLTCIVVAVTVCTLAVHTAAIRLTFAMARDNALPFGEKLARVNPKTQTPIVPAVVIGLIAALILVINIGQPKIFTVLTSIAIIMIYLAYLMVTGPMLKKRFQGQWPPKDLAEGGYFTMGKWGMLVNLVAVVWGIGMAVNLAWPREAVYGAPWYNTWGAFVYIGVILGAGLLWYGVKGRHHIGTLESHAAVAKAPKADV